MLVVAEFAVAPELVATPGVVVAVELVVPAPELVFAGAVLFDFDAEDELPAAPFWAAFDPEDGCDWVVWLLLVELLGLAGDRQKKNQSTNQMSPTTISRDTTNQMILPTTVKRLLSYMWPVLLLDKR